MISSSVLGTKTRVCFRSLSVNFNSLFSMLYEVMTANVRMYSPSNWRSGQAIIVLPPGSSLMVFPCVEYFPKNRLHPEKPYIVLVSVNIRVGTRCGRAVFPFVVVISFNCHSLAVSCALSPLLLLQPEKPSVTAIIIKIVVFLICV